MQTSDVGSFIGRTLGAYRIERLLGQSDAGGAYLAWHVERGQVVMVVTFGLPQSSPQERAQFRARFAQEGDALSRLDHPNILPIYDFGEHAGFLYLVTAFAKEASLSQVLKRQSCLNAQQTSRVFNQLAAALDYAHERGVVHGMLGLSNIMTGSELNVRIAGFGLSTMLGMLRQNRPGYPLAHLFSASGTFLGKPAYIAPEQVLGMPVSASSDIYALGIMLFELLTGILPFGGTDLLDIALQRLRQPMPSLATLSADVPEAFDLVIKKLGSRDPAKRYTRAGEAAETFARILNLSVEPQKIGTPGARQEAQNGQFILPPGVNWLEEQVTPSGKWQIIPPVVTGKMPALPPSEKTASGPNELFHQLEDQPVSRGKRAASPRSIDPFAWWSARSASSKADLAWTSDLARPTRAKARRRRPARQARRRLVTLLVAGTATAGALAVGGLSFTHLVQSMNRSQQQTMTPPGSNATPKKPSPVPTKGAHPTHTGMVIGVTGQALNSSKEFKNPRDGRASLLLHLTTGAFVACERACTHEGVLVNYDPASQMLVCPAHGAVFDPLHDFRHVAGPGKGPLASVAIRVNKDGTVTAD